MNLKKNGVSTESSLLFFLNISTLHKRVVLYFLSCLAFENQLKRSFPNEKIISKETLSFVIILKSLELFSLKHKSDFNLTTYSESSRCYLDKNFWRGTKRKKTLEEHIPQRPTFVPICLNWRLDYKTLSDHVTKHRHAGIPLMCAF